MHVHGTAGVLVFLKASIARRRDYNTEKRDDIL
jgi:hypothetical protein